jgi:hypothetical protein
MTAPVGGSWWEQRFWCPNTLPAWLFLRQLSVWDRFVCPNLHWTWACLQTDLIFISSGTVAEINVRLCLQDLEKRFCAVDSFPPKLLGEHVWDPFEDQDSRPRDLVMCSRS